MRALISRQSGASKAIGSSKLADEFGSTSGQPRGEGSLNRHSQNKLRKPRPDKPPESPAGSPVRRTRRRRLSDWLRGPFGNSASSSDQATVDLDSQISPEQLGTDEQILAPAEHDPFIVAVSTDPEAERISREVGKRLSICNPGLQPTLHEYPLQPLRPSPRTSRSGLQQWMRNPSAVSHSDFIPMLDDDNNAGGSSAPDHHHPIPDVPLPLFTRLQARQQYGDNRPYPMDNLGNESVDPQQRFSDIGTAWHVPSRASLSAADLFGNWRDVNGLAVAAVSSYPQTSPLIPAAGAHVDGGTPHASAKGDYGPQQLRDPQQKAKPEPGANRPRLSESCTASMAAGETVAQEREKYIPYRPPPSPQQQPARTTDSVHGPFADPGGDGFNYTVERCGDQHKYRHRRSGGIGVAQITRHSKDHAQSEDWPLRAFGTKGDGTHAGLSPTKVEYGSLAQASDAGTTSLDHREVVRTASAGIEELTDQITAMLGSDCQADPMVAPLPTTTLQRSGVDSGELIDNWSLSQRRWRELHQLAREKLPRPSVDHRTEEGAATDVIGSPASPVDQHQSNVGVEMFANLDVRHDDAGGAATTGPGEESVDTSVGAERVADVLVRASGRRGGATLWERRTGTRLTGSPVLLMQEMHRIATLPNGRSREWGHHL